MVSSTFTSSIQEQLPSVFLPNPVVNSKEYRQLNQGIQLKNNVNEGSSVWCHEDSEIDHSLSQKLVGLPNPKTLVQPVIMPPMYDNTFWRGNDFMIPRNINSQLRQELHQNGYLTSDIPIKESFQSFDQHNQFTSQPIQKQCLESTVPISNPLYPNHPGNTSALYKNESNYNTSYINAPYGYKNTSPYEYGLPVNYVPRYPQQAQPSSKEYNENIFTSTLQPNVYTRSQVIQPESVMSNLGISYTPQFLPTYSQITQGGGVLFTEFDPNIQPQLQTSCEVPFTIPESNVYDPRLTGYGPSNRYYLDHLTGRPMYMYDDVDSIRQNRFITRNALDFTDFGLQTGPQPNPSKVKTNMEIRNLAHNTFLDNTISFRTEMQERLMKKNSNREWQQKQSPLVKNQYTRAGSSATAGSVQSAYHGPRN